MQNFVGKTKCIVGYMKVANCLSGVKDEIAFQSDGLQLMLKTFRFDKI